MKLAAFEAQGRARWDKLAAQLDLLERGKGEANGVDVAGWPALYRQVCNDLALARDRELSSALVAELNQLALRGHQLLYQARSGDWRSLGKLVLREFPRAVRREWKLVLACHLLFYSLAVGLGSLAYESPTAIYVFMNEASVHDFENMYDPESGSVGKPRPADQDTQMFGFYIWNNVSIAFRTFASGLVFGAGTVLSLAWNALSLGLVAGHLAREGSAAPFFRFVVAHSAFELTAMLLAGAAGMRLGLSIVAPGPHTRLGALRAAARASLPIVAGSAAMLVIAAAIEAFWSPRLFPAAVKYAAGGVTWLLVGLWLWLGGRDGD
ncbi:MAG TPA: stage II sporulation protein M [Myxococcota bacterium]|nr:stage II sporulation protein M [Myxococcota bacterium]